MAELEKSGAGSPGLALNSIHLLQTLRAGITRMGHLTQLQNPQKTALFRPPESGWNQPRVSPSKEAYTMQAKSGGKALGLG